MMPNTSPAEYARAQQALIDEDPEFNGPATIIDTSGHVFRPTPAGRAPAQQPWQTAADLQRRVERLEQLEKVGVAANEFAAASKMYSAQRRARRRTVHTDRHTAQRPAASAAAAAAAPESDHRKHSVRHQQLAAAAAATAADGQGGLENLQASVVFWAGREQVRLLLLLLLVVLLVLMLLLLLLLLLPPLLLLL